jgi:hypothetical protein
MSKKNDLLILSEHYARVYENTNNAPEGDASAINMGPGGVLEIQPDGQHPNPPAQDVDSEESPEHENKMLKVARQLEPMANELFNIGSRISTGNATQGDGDLLIEYSTALEIMAGVITKEYSLQG